MTASTAKSFFWSFLEQGGSKAIALVVQIILARILAPETFGVLAIMLVVVEIANVVSQSGLGTALIQDKEADDVSCTTAFWLSMGTASVLYGVIFLSAPAIAEFYAMPDLVLCLRVLSIAVLVNAANSIQRSLLQKKMDFKTIFRANIAAVGISGLLGIATALAGWGVWALIIQVLSQGIVACIVMFVFVPWYPTILFEKARAKALFEYGWKICITGILGVIYTGVSELIIGKACSTEYLGFYSQGRKWPNAGISVASNAIQSVMFPAFAEMQDDSERLKRAIRKAISGGSYVVTPLALLACVSAKPIVELLLSDKWLPCVPVFQMTCAAYCLLLLQLVNLRAYMALGDSALYLKLQVIKVTSSCAIIWATAIMTNDIYCVAFATNACWSICVFVVDMRPAGRMHGVNRLEQVRLFGPIVGASVAAAIVAGAVLFLELHPLVTFLVQATLFAAVYFGISSAANLEGFVIMKTTINDLTARNRSKE